MKKMLEYQKLDLELSKLKKSSLNNTDRANLSKLKGYIVDFHNKGFKLEEDAKTLLSDYNKLKKQYDTNCKKVQELTNTVINDVTLDKVEGFLYQINSLSSELFFLERNINIIMTKIKESLQNFDITKKNIIKAKEKYNDCKEKCEKAVQAIAPRVKEIEKQMKEIEKEIPQDLFAKYNSIKADKIFPVFVALDNCHCSGCRVELPTAKVNKVKADGSIVCEQCHRIIYSK